MSCKQIYLCVIINTNVLKSIMLLSRDIDITGDIFCNIITDNSFHSSAESLFPLPIVCMEFENVILLNFI